MFIITAQVGHFTYYLQLAGKDKFPTLNGLKDNAVAYPTWDAAAQHVSKYRNDFLVELKPEARK